MITVVNANALHIPLPDQSVQCVITSPPYWGLRDYGVSGQIGLEKTPQEYTSNIVRVMREARRVLRDDGTLWLNLGDSYASNGERSNNNGQGKSGLKNDGRSEESRNHSNSIIKTNGLSLKKVEHGLKPKDLVGIPWMAAFALRADGWYLRSDIIWHKPNPMPESVTDRPTKAHEYIFLLAKSERYYYDAEAIKEDYTNSTRERMQYSAIPRDGKSVNSIMVGGEGNMLSNGVTRTTAGLVSHEARDNGGRNRRSVWTVATSPYSGAHFATFPPALVEPMVLAGSRRGDVVLDPFAGTATVGRVCAIHGRQFIGTELNLKYIDLADERTSSVQQAMGL